MLSRFFHKVPMIILVLDLLFVVSLFIAPMTLPEGTVTGLHGNANWIDYSDKWDDMGLFHRIIYTFGDFNCHQREERTIMVNGNQMPLCSRDVSIFVGILIGSMLLLRAMVSDSIPRTFLGFLPGNCFRGVVGRKPGLFMFLMIILLLLPTAMDGGIQLLFSYESTNPRRVITGITTGIAVGLIFSSILMTMFSRRDEGYPPLYKMMR